jgi:hypothetical protein
MVALPSKYLADTLANAKDLVGAMS